MQPLLSAAVLESVYPTMEKAVDNRLRLHFGAAGSWLSPLPLMQLEPRLGAAAEQLRPIDRLRLLRSSVLLHGAEGPGTPAPRNCCAHSKVLPEPKEF